MLVIDELMDSRLSVCRTSWKAVEILLRGKQLPTPFVEDNSLILSRKTVLFNSSRKTVPFNSSWKTVPFISVEDSSP